jgi:hypothetical protein
MARPGFLICLAAAGDALVRSTRMEATIAYEAVASSGRTLAIGFVALALLGGGFFFIVAMVKASARRTRGWIIAAIVSGIVSLGGLFVATGMLADWLGEAVRSTKAAADRKKPPAAEQGR